ncbi:54S ribosomal protein L49, mitochondrial [Hanseniaspora osmophila]|uniref:Large ribosomal subunit protein bL21m n=1 Tax=Hanseniaspora osmophila TaxID=56408 RepID=A0A1E5RA49_9ASCO|nr:54S ribosomal protein L49, mitochondrial [Hanseniaspora osmophila]
MFKNFFQKITTGLPSSGLRQFSTSKLFLNQVSTKPTLNVEPLKLSNELYAIFKIHNRPYLVTEGDKVILPFRMKNVEVGDILKLNDVTTIGSRNYKLIDYPIDESVYSLQAVVTEKTKRPMRIREVTKRRSRRTRHAKNKADLTILKISELKVN